MKWRVTALILLWLGVLVAIRVWAQGTSDPCMAGGTKSSIPIAAATATTIPLLSGPSPLTGPINICSLSVVVNATSSFQLIAGNGTACASNQQAVTGAFTATVTSGNGTTTIATVPNGLDLCAVFTGTGANGGITYVQGGVPVPTSTGTVMGVATPTFTATPTKTPTGTPTGGGATFTATPSQTPAPTNTATPTPQGIFLRDLKQSFSSGGGTTSLTASLPTGGGGITQNDILVAFDVNTAVGVPPCSPVNPSGWTEIGRVTNTYASQKTDIALMLTAGVSPPSAPVFTCGGAAQIDVVILDYANATKVDAFGGNFCASCSAVSTAAVTASGVDMMAVNFASDNAGSFIGVSGSPALTQEFYSPGASNQWVGQLATVAGLQSTYTMSESGGADNFVTYSVLLH